MRGVIARDKMCERGVLRVIGNQAQEQKEAQRQTNRAFDFSCSFIVRLFFFHVVAESIIVIPILFQKREDFTSSVNVPKNQP